MNQQDLNVWRMYACAALTGCLSTNATFQNKELNIINTASGFAEIAAEYADAMLAEEQKRRNIER